MTTPFEKKIHDIWIKYIRNGADPGHELCGLIDELKEAVREIVPKEQIEEDGDNEETKFGVQCFNHCRTEMLNKLEAKE